MASNRLNPDMIVDVIVAVWQVVAVGQMAEKAGQVVAKGMGLMHPLLTFPPLSST